MVKAYIINLITPLVIRHIQEGNKIIISQHTGSAVIDQSLKDLYELTEQNTPSSPNNNLILFASNHMLTSSGPRDVIQKCYKKNGNTVFEWPTLTLIQSVEKNDLSPSEQVIDFSKLKRDTGRSR